MSALPEYLPKALHVLIKAATDDTGTEDPFYDALAAIQRYGDERAALAAAAPGQQTEPPYCPPSREERLRAAMERMDKVGRPLPGMIAAFEHHFGQTWTDPDWRDEASVWASAWRAALCAGTKAP